MRWRRSGGLTGGAEAIGSRSGRQRFHAGDVNHDIRENAPVTQTWTTVPRKGKFKLRHLNGVNVHDSALSILDSDQHWVRKMFMPA
ncbi:hypothetical protein SAMN06265222_12822 [Neorhodopirellula lusitana]|uniref:Uncharacterized protein n=1 Tax=Neorhodopirellula lusitana TaxID=445327 RepID=A0ABY1QTP6_9BACT|nr:hypothetical protein SAMN06265222_12822 [Neorhodopirellula lusitana]